MAVIYFEHTPVSTHIETGKPDQQKEYCSHFWPYSISGRCSAEYIWWRYCSFTMPKEIVWLSVCLFTVGLQMVYKTVSLGKIMAYNGKNCLWLRGSSLHKDTWHMDMVLVVVHLTSIYSTVSTFPLSARCTKFIVPSLILIHLCFSHCPCRVYAINSQLNCTPAVLWHTNYKRKSLKTLFLKERGPILSWKEHGF